ncbi:MAG: sulfatase-like hydrolase/transferase, partial [Myxococcota bacterium]|nr:sulfatase-like hydrolase/transferase [Myxococcota bacterium]
MSPKPIRTATLLTLALGLAALCLWGLRSRAQPPHSILIVLDTVRADRLSLCGYDRPTSPTLVSLARAGFTSTCEAYTPGTWTLPSHASFFTGVDVLTHRAHALTDGIDDLSGTQART